MTNVHFMPTGPKSRKRAPRLGAAEAVATGEYLLKMRSALPRGTFKAWFRGRNMGFSYASATKYMAMAEAARAANEAERLVEAPLSGSTGRAPTWGSVVEDDQESTYELADFTSTLARALKAELTDLNEPVFPNPKTGKDASSIFAIMRVLRYFYRPHWSELVAIVKTVAGDAAFTRRDLPKTSSTYPTLCLDLEAVERVLAEVQPRKAPKLIQAFKDRHGITK